MAGDMWNGYMNWSDKNGESLFNLTSVINKDVVVNDLKKVRNYWSVTSLLSIPFFLNPTTIPIGVGIATGAWGISLTAWAVQSYITNDTRPLLSETISVGAGAAIWYWLKTVGILSKVEFNTTAMRYMWEYTDNAYGFISAKTASIGYAVTKSVEQISGFISWLITN